MRCPTLHVVQHYLRRAKYIDQSRAGGISAIIGSYFNKIAFLLGRWVSMRMYTPVKPRFV